MTKREPTPLRIWLQIAKSSANLEHSINGKLRENYGQSLSRFDVLSQFIRTGEDELSVGALSKELIASSGNISRLLDRMQKDGLIVRKHSDKDRRSVYIRITKSAINYSRQWPVSTMIGLQKCSQVCRIINKQNSANFSKTCKRF